MPVSLTTPLPQPSGDREKPKRGWGGVAAKPGCLRAAWARTSAESSRRAANTNKAMDIGAALGCSIFVVAIETAETEEHVAWHKRDRSVTGTFSPASSIAEKIISPEAVGGGALGRGKWTPARQLEITARTATLPQLSTKKRSLCGSKAPAAFQGCPSTFPLSPHFLLRLPLLLFLTYPFQRF